MLDKVIDNRPRQIRRHTLALVCLGALCMAPLSLVQGQSSSIAVVKSPHAVVANSKARLTSKRSGKTVKTTAKSTQISKPAKTSKKPNLSLTVYQLKYTSAETTAKILQQVFSFGNPPSGKVSADTRTNSLIVSADEGMSAQISNLIQKLDQSSSVEPKSMPASSQPLHVTMFTLSYAQSGEVSRALRTLFQGQGADRVEIVEDRRTNSLMVTASTSTINEMQKVIRHLDIPAQPTANQSESMRVFPLKYGKAAALCTTLSALLNIRQGEVVSPDAYSNTLIVRASEKRLDEIAQVIRSLDRAKE